MTMDYRSRVPTGLTISSKLRDACVELFYRFDEFIYPEKLRAFVNVRGLALVDWCIPRKERLDFNEFIPNLIAWKLPVKNAEPAMFDLLAALAKHYDQSRKTDAEECRKFAETLRSELTGSGNPEQAKDYERLVERNVTSDEREVSALAERWVEEAGDNLEELALRITLAVFNGTAFEVIERAKDDLLESLRQLVPPFSSQIPLASTPHVPLTRRLEKAGAKETDGKPPDWRRVVELDRPGIAGEALSYVWRRNRETKWRQKLIEWLTKYAVGHAADVRTRAAVAVGILAVKDYRFVREHLLNRWVDENTAEYRMAVGMALGVIVREEFLSAEVQNLLRKWSGSDRLDERWAAARAYLYVGDYCRPVSEVITRWRQIAASELIAVYVNIPGWEKPVELRNPLYMSLMDAMVRFFTRVAQQPVGERRFIYTGILEGLTSWIGDNSEDTWLALFMLSIIGRLRSSPAEDGDADSPPLLLQLVETEQAPTAYRRQLAGLFELAMRKGATIVEAKDLLCEWLGWANGVRDNSHLYETRIQTLFNDMIAADTTGRMRGKLAACLRDCGRNRVAQNILSSL